MAFKHGKDTFISLDGDDLSPYTTTSQLEKSADSHDTTTYGQDAHTFQGGLLNGTATMSGIYDSSTSSGPAAIIDGLVGTNVTLIRQTEGVGAGLPSQSVNVLVLKYTETSPVADMITWSCDLQLSGTITRSTQT